MSSPPTLTGVDFKRFAAVMDGYLPIIEPVGRAILERLPPMPEGANVLDVACGTGEPGLTLARERRTIRLLGIDSVPEMIDIARAKAAREGLAHARFEVMHAEHVACADQSFDAVISRFGLLMFGDTMAAALELRRLLRPGSCFSLAVWDDVATNTVVRSVTAALRPFVAPDLLAPFEVAPGAQAGDRLRDAGLAHARSEPFQWNYSFADEAALWQFVSGPGIFARQFAALDAGSVARVHAQLLTALSTYRSDDGRYAIPHTCRLWWGTA